MLIHATCPICGEAGREPALHEGSDLACPGCGGLLDIRVLPAALPPPGPATDENILGWVTRPVGITWSAPAPEENCSACGYAGPMLPDGVCPACFERPHPRTRAGRVIRCPDCRGEIEVREADRGRTIICPACKHFLGCVLPSKGIGHWWRMGRAGAG